MEAPPDAAPAGSEDRERDAGAAGGGSGSNDARNGNSNGGAEDHRDTVGDDLEEIILQLALSNAASHGGRTMHKAILGKVLGARKDLRGSIPAVSEAVESIVSQVNAMTQEEQRERLDLSGEGAAAERPGQTPGAAEDTGRGGTEGDAPGSWLPPIAGAEYGTVTTRFPPEPNGYPHIGHAKAVIINRDYAAKYGGRCILRIDDTNPDAERKEYLAGINVGLEWLGLEFAPQDIKYTSDDMEVLYKKGEELIQSGMAYVCTCKKDDISKNRMERKECKCRRKEDPDEHYKRWSKMHTKSKSGEAVARFRGDMKSDNAVMRDPVLFRVISTPHYRQGSKYRVWPSYDMSVAVEDSVHGVTDAFRSKEFESRAQLIDAILDALRMRKPRQHYFARLAFEGMPTSKRVIRPLMEDGRIMGYDDPRIPTLGGLRRRGIRPRAVRRFIESLGMTKSDTVAPFETLESLNRSEVDPQSTRLFMARDARRLVISDPDGHITDGEIEMPNHPLHGDMGTRRVPTSHDVYIPGADFEKIGVGSIVRLLGLAYVCITGIGDPSRGADPAGGEIRRIVTTRGSGSGSGGSVRYVGADGRGKDVAVAAHAECIAGIGDVFGPQDILDYNEKKGLPMPPEKRAQLEEGARLEHAKEAAGPAPAMKGQRAQDAGGKRMKTPEDAKMQWVSRETAVAIRLVIPRRPFDGDAFVSDSLEEAEVYTEPHFENIEEGAEIQFVRFGYCRKDSGRRVIFTHD